MRQKNMSNRIKNTRRNLLVGSISKIVFTVLPFLIRTVILWLLGVEYMGLGSLFTSILQVLNLAELGFSSAITFSMYKPIAQGDEETVCALMAYYKKIYRMVGTTIGTAGIVLLPFIRLLIYGTWPEDVNIYLLYVIYLFNTVSSYFLYAYKTALLTAVQRIDLVNGVQLLVFVLQYLLQFIILLFTKNYYLYLLVTPAFTVICNCITGFLADKHFPQFKPKGLLSGKMKLDIKRQVAGLMMGKLSDTSRNSFDSIVLSALFGLTVVAVYNNYYYIYHAVYGILLTITQALQASVGNSIALEDANKNYNDLRKFTFIFGWITGWCTTCMLCLYQQFMTIWAGEKLLLLNRDMVLFCVYFYAINMNNSRNLYFNGKGLWWAGKATFILEAISNMILNICLGIKLGVTGILTATIITIIIFNFISRTNILFEQYFKRKPSQFYCDHIRYAAATTGTAFLTYVLCERILIENVIFSLMIKAIICFFLPHLIFSFFYRNYNQYMIAVSFLKNVFRK